MFTRAAERLFEAHERRERFAPLAPGLAPRTESEAYGIQDAFVALRAQKLGAIAGYKIALTSAEMRRFVGVDTPMAGVMLESTIKRSPGRLRAADYVRLIVEFEIAVEIADDRDADYKDLARHPFELIADNCWNEGAVLGAPVEGWQAIDLAAVRGVATINGNKVGQGRGADAMGHPLDVVAWLADHLASIGRGLLRGDVVITGSIVTTKTVTSGDFVLFDIDKLGSVELRID